MRQSFGARRAQHRQRVGGRRGGRRGPRSACARQSAIRSSIARSSHAGRAARLPVAVADRRVRRAAAIASRARRERGAGSRRRRAPASRLRGRSRAAGGKSARPESQRNAFHARTPSRVELEELVARERRSPAPGRRETRRRPSTGRPPPRAWRRARATLIVTGSLLSGMSASVVTPPAAAARVACAKPSHSVRPGSLTWTCASTRPGMSTRSPRSSTPAGAASPAPIGSTPAMRSPSTTTSAATMPSGVTTRRLRRTSALDHRDIVGEQLACSLVVERGSSQDCAASAPLHSVDYAAVDARPSRLLPQRERRRVGGAAAFSTLTEYLRDELRLVGTKVVCAEGDCGACSVLVGRPARRRVSSIGRSTPASPSCYQLDASHVVTVEGLARDGALHPVQQAMIDGYGSQCGFCTPGIVMALAGHFEAGGTSARRALTGNLCRCTGYWQILESAAAVDAAAVPRLAELYPEAAMLDELRAAERDEVRIAAAPRELYLPADLEAACRFKAEHPDCLVVAGATDVAVRRNKGARRARRGARVSDAASPGSSTPRSKATSFAPAPAPPGRTCSSSPVRAFPRWPRSSSGSARRRSATPRPSAATSPTPRRSPTRCRSSTSWARWSSWSAPEGRAACRSSRSIAATRSSIFGPAS